MDQARNRRAAGRTEHAHPNEHVKQRRKDRFIVGEDGALTRVDSANAHALNTFIQMNPDIKSSEQLQERLKGEEYKLPAPRRCECGCGAIPTLKKSKFCAGHDYKHVKNLKARFEQGNIDALLELIQRGWAKHITIGGMYNFVGRWSQEDYDPRICEPVHLRSLSVDALNKLMSSRSHGDKVEILRLYALEHHRFNSIRTALALNPELDPNFDDL